MRWLDDLFGAAFLGTCVKCGESSLRATCSQCQTIPPEQLTTPLGTVALALGAHEEPLAGLVRRLKYKDETLIASRLGSALGLLVPRPWREATFAPVPLHPERLASRGYNQSALIARAAGQVAGMRVATDLLWRTVNTDAQARLTKAERSTNVHGAFVARSGERAFSSARTSIVLLDDVVTTGNTLDACCLALRDAGFHVLGAMSCTVGSGRFEGATEYRAKTR